MLEKKALVKRQIKPSCGHSELEKIENTKRYRIKTKAVGTNHPIRVENSTIEVR